MLLCHRVYYILTHYITFYVCWCDGTAPAATTPYKPAAHTHIYIVRRVTNSSVFFFRFFRFVLLCFSPSDPHQTFHINCFLYGICFPHLCFLADTHYHSVTRLHTQTNSLKLRYIVILFIFQFSFSSLFFHLILPFFISAFFLFFLFSFYSIASSLARLPARLHVCRSVCYLL